MGFGAEERPADEVAGDCASRLARAGWQDRAEVLVLEPELDIWMWSRSPHVDEALGWHGRNPSLRDWLEQRGLWPTQASKPPDPKRALEEALYEVRLPRSSAIYRQVAERVGFRACRDPGFLRLRQILTTWFA